SAKGSDHGAASPALIPVHMEDNSGNLEIAELNLRVSHDLAQPHLAKFFQRYRLAIWWALVYESHVISFVLLWSGPLRAGRFRFEFLGLSSHKYYAFRLYVFPNSS